MVTPQVSSIEISLEKDARILNKQWIYIKPWSGSLDIWAGSVSCPQLQMGWSPPAVGGPTTFPIRKIILAAWILEWAHCPRIDSQLFLGWGRGKEKKAAKERFFLSCRGEIVCIEYERLGISLWIWRRVSKPFSPKAENGVGQDGPGEIAQKQAEQDSRESLIRDDPKGPWVGSLGNRNRQHGCVTCGSLQVYVQGNRGDDHSLTVLPTVPLCMCACALADEFRRPQKGRERGEGGVLGLQHCLPCVYRISFHSY